MFRALSEVGLSPARCKGSEGYRGTPRQNDGGFNGRSMQKPSDVVATAAAPVAGLRLAPQMLMMSRAFMASPQRNKILLLGVYRRGHRRQCLRPDQAQLLEPTLLRCARTQGLTGVP